MSTVSNEVKRMYEGLFLFPQSAAGNLQAAVDQVTDLLTRAGAEIVSLAKWDERRLAYEIKGNKRGVYFLAYFLADPGRLTGLERDCNLSETVLRAMVTRAEHMPTEMIAAADGRERLADEIKLRATEAESESKTTAAVVTTKETPSEESPAPPAASPAASPAAPTAASPAAAPATPPAASPAAPPADPPTE